ncbi:MAG TPA: 2-hydroxyacid dehydrogenase [Jiangellales bacterium]|nr:2-hydroxyacid dehydrogenase [Jiangellales bacterium]
MPEPRCVLLPYPPEGVLADLPDSLEVHVWDGAGEPPVDVLDRVELYVVPYTFRTEVAEVAARMPRLTAVQTLTAGVEHLRPYVREGVLLCNARGVHDASTAELALALVLASLRGIPGFVRAQDRQQWAHVERPALADRTVLVVGYGSVGAAVERRLLPFECDVLRVARTAREGVAGIDDLPGLLPRADVVVLTLPLTDETRGLVDGGFLAAMRDGALLVNVARGPVVHTDALLAELAGGRLAAALDVTDPEPPPPGHPLWSVPGLLLSPHVGGNTSAFLPRALRLVRDQLDRFAADRPLAHVMTADY